MPTIKELEEQLAAAKAAEAAESIAKGKIAADAWNTMCRNPDAFEWSVRPDKYSVWAWDSYDRAQVDGLYVMKRLKDEAIESYRAVYGRVTDTDRTQWKGMFYYRTDEGILTHDGGGTVVLRDPMLCSDAEWAELVAGRIPAKFKR